MPRRPPVTRVLVAALLASGCGDGDVGPLQVRENAFVWQDAVPAGATLHVRDLNGDIEVTPSPDDTARVTARLEWRRGNPDDVVRFSGARLGADALICATWGQSSCTVGDYNTKIEGGDAMKMRVFFTVSVPAGVRLDLIAVNGDLAAAASAPVRARTMNGEVRIATSVGPVRAESMNGGVDIRMSSLVGTDSVIAKTLNGNAFIYLTDSVDAVVDLRVTNGSVSSDFPVLMTGEAGGRRSIRGTIGQGGRTVHARSMNGEVALRRLDAEGRSH